MLARKNRFHGHGGVKRAYRLGRPTRSALFSIHVHRDNRIKKTRVAVVVSKKVHKSAVKRNRIRRRLYEGVRLELDRIKTPAEIIITVYSPDVADISHEEITKNINDLLKKSRLV